MRRASDREALRLAIRDAMDEHGNYESGDVADAVLALLGAGPPTETDGCHCAHELGCPARTPHIHDRDCCYGPDDFAARMADEDGGGGDVIEVLHEEATATCMNCGGPIHLMRGDLTGEGKA